MNPALNQHALVPKGPQAAHIADLFWFYGFVLAVVCILVWVFVLIALFRRNAEAESERPPRLDEEALQGTSPAAPVELLRPEPERMRGRVVAAAGGLTIVTLFVLLYQSIATGALISDAKLKPAVRIEVVGHRWWWGVRYLDEQPSNIFASANEIHVPVGRPVELVLTSADVIHSFWVPNLHGKRDLVPGHPSRLMIQADKPGTYRGQCAEFCGHAHAQMALLVIAESPARFEAYKKAQRTTARAPVTAEEKRGQEVFLNGPCMLCHTISGTPAQASTGPGLSHLASRTTLAAAMLPNNRGNLAGWVVNAQHLKPGTAMPNITFPAQDLHALIAYLESLK
jgi:cytochrome c oxidase subunit 2